MLREYQRINSTNPVGDRYGIVSANAAHLEFNGGQVIGNFTHNPITTTGHPEIEIFSVFRQGLNDASNIEIQAYALVESAAYEVSKGSALGSGDILTIQVSRKGETTRALRLTYQREETVDGTNYAIFTVSDSAASLSALRTQNVNIVNFYNLVRSSHTASSDKELTLILYEGNSTDPNDKLAGRAKGFTEVYDNRETENRNLIESIQNDISGLSTLTTKVNRNAELLKDTSLGNVGVENWNSAPLVTDGAVFFSSTELNLTGVRNVANNSWQGSLSFDLSQRGYLYIRVPHTRDNRTARLVTEVRDGSGFRTVLNNLWNMGNSADGNYKYFGFFNQEYIDGSVRFVEVEVGTSVQGSVYRGRTAGPFVDVQTSDAISLDVAGTLYRTSIDLPASGDLDDFNSWYAWWVEHLTSGTTNANKNRSRAAVNTIDRGPFWFDIRQLLDLSSLGNVASIVRPSNLQNTMQMSDMIWGRGLEDAGSKLFVGNLTTPVSNRDILVKFGKVR